MNTTNWKSENLPENLKNILQKRPNTVFISFGSVIRSADMPQEYKYDHFNLNSENIEQFSEMQ